MVFDEKQTILKEPFSKLLIFNLELNLDSKVLASSHDWVHAFSNLFNETRVISTHVGRTELSRDTIIIELKGGV